MSRVLATGLTMIVVAGSLAACGSDAPKNPPLVFRPIAVCAAAVVVPPDVTTTTPSAEHPPTTILAVGEAAAFPSVRGAQVEGAGEDSVGVVCQATRRGGGQPQTVIVGLRNGFVQVGLIVGSNAKPARVLVTVTG